LVDAFQRAPPKLPETKRKPVDAGMNLVLQRHALEEIFSSMPAPNKAFSERRPLPLLAEFRFTTGIALPVDGGVAA
jgi:hypothetical protein